MSLTPRHWTTAAAALIVVWAIFGGAVLMARADGHAPLPKPNLLEAEAVFHHDGRNTVVRVVTVDSSPAETSAALDALLAERGYPAGDALRAPVVEPGATPAPGVHAAFGAPFASWNTDDVPLPVHFNPAAGDGLPDLEAAAAFAIDTWNAVQGSTFEFSYAGHTSDSTCVGSAPNEDGRNVVAYASLANANVLGITCSLYEDDGTYLEFDMELNTKVTWSGEEDPEDAFDLWTTVLHEFGHAMGLSHPDFSEVETGPDCPDGQVMQPTASQGRSVRALCPDDISAVHSLYSDGSQTPDPTATSPATPSATSTPAAPTPTTEPTPTPTPTGTPSPTPSNTPDPSELERGPFRVVVPGATGGGGD